MYVFEGNFNRIKQYMQDEYRGKFVEDDDAYYNEDTEDDYRDGSFFIKS